MLLGTFTTLSYIKLQIIINYKLIWAKYQIIKAIYFRYQHRH